MKYASPSLPGGSKSLDQRSVAISHFEDEEAPKIIEPGSLTHGNSEKLKGDNDEHLQAHHDLQGDLKGHLSSLSLQAQAGLPLEKQGKQLALMRDLFLYWWLSGTVITGAILIVVHTEAVLPVQANGGEWMAITIIEAAVLIYASLLSKLVDRSIKIWSMEQLAKGQGSLAVLGYIHCPTLKRMGFLSKLSYRSLLRTRLLWISWVQVLLLGLHVLAIVAGTGITLEESTVTEAASCYVPATTGASRGSVTGISVSYVSGAASYVTSSSMGHMKIDGYAQSIGILGPEVDGYSGAFSVSGKAVLMLMNSTCQCGVGSIRSWQMMHDDAGTGTNLTTSDLPNVNRQAGYGVALASTFTPKYDASGRPESFVLNQELFDGEICGGGPSRLQCLTISGLSVGTATVEYMASKAGIAPAMKGVTTITDSHTSYPPPDDFASVVMAWQRALNSTEIMTRLKANSAPPLLSWMSRDGGLSIALGSVGIDMLNMMLFRQGYALTAAVTVDSCEVKTAGSGSKVTTSGATMSILLVLMGATFSAGIIAVYRAWRSDRDPTRMGICGRIHDDIAILMQACSQSEYLTRKLESMCNAETPEIWSALDNSKFAIGESISTIDEEVGHITIGSAKMIRPLQIGRRYAGKMVLPSAAE
ncbi:uncharacterized protein EV422DRAFT_546356 [Fimicolochytrium jonesii]|uniref:uncharacterized protein n=1 Tax=Fimicolochytrium jonesii TaxID=1396493 RepID=UPI0022FDF7D5|nr:uncharacterized protein EV422DRAFT_546356 [Fimicolochytrium jonesii]KAI8816345.1 hypothetical protein EV422DRAFT_546356 [Fimicolochytrium jonesii]